MLYDIKLQTEAHNTLNHAAGYVLPEAGALLSTPAVITALMVKFGQALSFEDIVILIASNLPVVESKFVGKEDRKLERALDSVIKYRAYKYEPLFNLKREVRDGLRAYDVGFQRHAMPAGPSLFSIDENRAWNVLRQCTGGSSVSLIPSDGTTQSPFDNLPDEILLMIFEYILILPQSGVRVYRDSDYWISVEDHEGETKMKFFKQLVCLARDKVEEKTYSDWCNARFSELTSWSYHTQDNVCTAKVVFDTFTTPLSTLLDLLAVNRKFYATAAPIFYGKNFFRTNSLTELDDLFSDLVPDRTPAKPNTPKNPAEGLSKFFPVHLPERIGLLRHVSVEYRHYDWRLAIPLFKRITELNIKILGLVMLKQNFIRDRLSKAGPNVYWHASKIHGIATLCKYPGSIKKIHVEGGWREVAVYIRKNSKIEKVTFNGTIVNKV